MSKQLSAEKKAEIVAYTKTLISGVMNWYSTGAVDCKETRININKDLDTVLATVLKKYRLKPIKRVLRARSDGRGWFTVRLEDPSLN